ncbi:MAG: hypothetical protein R3E63_07420 [Pseudomonadales bacterium]
MGHVRNYTIGDVISRFQRMQGKKCFTTRMGLAYPLKMRRSKTIPRRQNGLTKISNMKGNCSHWVLATIGREIATCRPDYYKWEQWFFTRLYEKGLVYKKMATDILIVKLYSPMNK